MIYDQFNRWKIDILDGFKYYLLNALISSANNRHICWAHYRKQMNEWMNIIINYHVVSIEPSSMDECENKNRKYNIIMIRQEWEEKKRGIHLVRSEQFSLHWIDLFLLWTVEYFIWCSFLSFLIT